MIKDGNAIASMPSKKKNHKKLDLSHLSTIQPSVSPLGDKPVEEQPETPASVKDPTPIQEEPAPTPEIVEKSPQEEPPPALVKEAPNDNERRYETKKPQRVSFKALKTIESATNSAGEVFKLGDKILPKSPWSTRALAEITAIYEDNQGDVWVQYLPLEEVPDGWSWLGGVTRAALLLKA